MRSPVGAGIKPSIEHEIPEGEDKNGTEIIDHVHGNIKDITSEASPDKQRKGEKERKF